MAGPITGVGAQQASLQPQQATQSSQQNSVRESQDREREPVANVVQPRGTAAAETNKADAQNQNLEHIDHAVQAASEDQNNNQRPGSIVDILV